MCGFLPFPFEPQFQGKQKRLEGDHTALQLPLLIFANPPQMGQEQTNEKHMYNGMNQRVYVYMYVYIYW